MGWHFIMAQKDGGRWSERFIKSSLRVLRNLFPQGDDAKCGGQTEGFPGPGLEP